MQLTMQLPAEKLGLTTEFHIDIHGWVDVRAVMQIVIIDIKFALCFAVFFVLSKLQCQTQLAMQLPAKKHGLTTEFHIDIHGGVDVRVVMQ